MLAARLLCLGLPRLIVAFVAIPAQAQSRPWIAPLGSNANDIARDARPGVKNSGELDDTNLTKAQIHEPARESWAGRMGRQALPQRHTAARGASREPTGPRVFETRGEQLARCSPMSAPRRRAPVPSASTSCPEVVREPPSGGFLRRRRASTLGASGRPTRRRAAVAEGTAERRQEASCFGTHPVAEFRLGGSQGHAPDAASQQASSRLPDRGPGARARRARATR